MLPNLHSDQIIEQLRTAVLIRRFEEEQTPFAPVPASIVLEKAFVPGEEQIIEAVRQSIAYNRVA